VNSNVNGTNFSEQNEEEVYYYLKTATIRNITSMYGICVYISRLFPVLNSWRARSSFFWEVGLGSVLQGSKLLLFVRKPYSSYVYITHSHTVPFKYHEASKRSINLMKTSLGLTVWGGEGRVVSITRS